MRCVCCLFVLLLLLLSLLCSSFTFCLKTRSCPSSSSVNIPYGFDRTHANRSDRYDNRERHSRTRLSNRLYFQKTGTESGGGSESKAPFFSRIVPGIFKKKVQKPQTETDTSMRYELRLKDADVKNRRHITTRLQRYLPDLQFETAQDIVDAAIESELG